MLLTTLGLGLDVNELCDESNFSVGGFGACFFFFPLIVSTFECELDKEALDPNNAVLANDGRSLSDFCPGTLVKLLVTQYFNILVHYAWYTNGVSVMYSRW